MYHKTVLTFLAVLVLAPAAAAMAQVNYGYGQGAYSMGWLWNPQVQKELEIVDFQLKEIKELQTKLQADVREVYADIGKLPREEQMERYKLAQEKTQKIYQDANDKLEDILLPQQIRRLEQVTTQMQMRGGASYGLRGELAKKLEITEEQQKELREKAAEKNKELYRKWAELKAEAEQELLADVLTEKQRKQLQEMLGEPFEFQTGRAGVAQGAGGK